MTAPEGSTIVDLWRFPELAVRLRAQEPVPARDLAQLIAQGLGEQHTPEAAVLRLVHLGEYAAAADVLESVADTLGQRVTKRLTDHIADERDTLVDRMRIEGRLLRNRAERIDFDADIDVDALADLGRVRRVEAQARLEKLEGRVDDAERTEINRITEDMKGRPDPVLAAQVHALLAAKEIRAARQVLEGGPGLSSVLPVEEPTAVWPWRREPLDQIIGWLDRATMLAPPGVREYVLDSAGETLLEALRELSRAFDGNGHALLATAVQELIGVTGIPPVAEPLPSGQHRATILVGDEFRLPPMGFVGRGHGLNLTIGGDAPAASSGVAAWLTTSLDHEPSRGEVTVDLADLLGLLQSERRGSGRPRSTSSRRMGFIRTICRQLDVEAVLPPDAFATVARSDLRHQIWWLLHAFGLFPDGVGVDTLLYESGAHPRLLVHCVHHIVREARAASTVRLQPATFDALRMSAPYAEAVLDDLLADLGDAAAAALFAAIFFASADDIRSALETIAADAELDVPLDALIDVDAVTSDLLAAGHLITEGSGRRVLCECGITALLRRGDAHELAKDALRRLDRTGPGPAAPADRDARVRDAEFQRRLVEIALHHERTRADRAESALSKERGMSMLIRDDRRRREDRQTVEAWQNERISIDLFDACQIVARDIEMVNADVDIVVALAGPGDAAPVTVVGSRVALHLALANIISNAEQASGRAGTGSGTVRVMVSVAAGPPAVAVVDVEDDGDGMPGPVIESLRNDTPPASSRRDGEGMGLIGARALLRQQFRGELHVVETASAALGGAHVRLVLPVTALPPATGR